MVPWQGQGAGVAVAVVAVGAGRAQWRRGLITHVWVFAPTWRINCELFWESKGSINICSHFAEKMQFSGFAFVFNHFQYAK